MRERSDGEERGEVGGREERSEPKKRERERSEAKKRERDRK